MASDLGFCGHHGMGVWLEPDATELLWCQMCGAMSRDGGEVWTLPRMESARRHILDSKKGADEGLTVLPE